MLNRVALDREQRFADVLLDFVPDLDTSWPDLSRGECVGRLDPGSASAARLTSWRCSPSPWIALSQEERANCKLSA